LDDLLAANRANWDERTALHLEAYPVETLREGGITLRPIELAEIGEVAGRTLLHLQCHFGLDTLSWARLGARVTGADFSPAAIDAARALAADLGIEARFILSDVLSLPSVLDGRFDIVLATYGVFAWIPDVPRWMQVAAGFLRPGGLLYVADGHPLGHLLDQNGTALRKGARYFDAAPERDEQHGSYVGEPRLFQNPVTFQWQHTLGEIVTAALAAGLQIEFLHEWPVTDYRAVEGMEQGEDGYWRLPDDRWPFLFSLRARRSSSHREAG
jgi:SAM-dependent methyltransferase